MTGKNRQAILCLMFIAALFMPMAAQAKHAEVIVISDSINPAVNEYISESIARAESNGAECLIIQLDTPGGLLTSTQKIVQDILKSKVPVVVYISPRGSWAASAGTFITLASHIAVMAPATNIGAAHPVSMTPSSGEKAPKDTEDPDNSSMERKLDKLIARFGSSDKKDNQDTKGDEKSDKAATEGDSETGKSADDTEDEPVIDKKKAIERDIMSEKIIQNTTAWIRGIAEYRNRNAEWAEKAVTESLSITEKEALEMNVIDLIANDLEDLLTKINGKTVETAAGAKTIDTDRIQINTYQMSLRQRILSTISNPNLFFILALLGPLGLVIELYNPGLILPGVVGGISIILLLYASQVLPVNFAAILLIMLAIILFIAEVKIQSFGLLTTGGVISLVLGALMLFRTGPELPGDTFRVAWSTIITVLVIVLAFVFLVLERVFRLHSQKPSTGVQGMVGLIGVTKTAITESGTVQVHGELWRATSEIPVEEGKTVEVIAIDGLTLKVIERIMR